MGGRDCVASRFRRIVLSSNIVCVASGIFQPGVPVSNSLFGNAPSAVWSFGTCCHTGRSDIGNSHMNEY